MACRRIIAKKCAVNEVADKVEGRPVGAAHWHNNRGWLNVFRRNLQWRTPNSGAVWRAYSGL